MLSGILYAEARIWNFWIGETMAKPEMYTENMLLTAQGQKDKHMEFCISGWKPFLHRDTVTLSAPAMVVRVLYGFSLKFSIKI